MTGADLPRHVRVWIDDHPDATAPVVLGRFDVLDAADPDDRAAVAAALKADVPDGPTRDRDGTAATTDADGSDDVDRPVDDGHRDSGEIGSPDGDSRGENPRCDAAESGSSPAVVQGLGFRPVEEVSR